MYGWVKCSCQLSALSIQLNLISDGDALSNNYLSTIRGVILSGPQAAKGSGVYCLSWAGLRSGRRQIRRSGGCPLVKQKKGRVRDPSLQSLFLFYYSW